MHAPVHYRRLFGGEVLVIIDHLTMFGYYGKLTFLPSCFAIWADIAGKLENGV